MGLVRARIMWNACGVLTVNRADTSRYSHERKKERKGDQNKSRSTFFIEQTILCVLDVCPYHVCVCVG